MTNYNDLVGRHLVRVSVKKGDQPEIIISVDGIIEEVDATTMKNSLFVRIKGVWAACIDKSDIDTAMTAAGREVIFDTYYTYIKIV